MKRILLFTTVLFFSFLIFIKAQTPNRVTVNTVIVPPYSTKITDYLIYENRAVITVTALGNAGTNYQIYFQGSVIGDNGVSIKTKDNYYPSKPFELQANIPKRMSGDDLRDYFDWDYVDVAGVSTQTIIRTNGIPEGNYKICFQAYDYLTRQPIGSEQCSAPIHVSDVNPPRLIAPMCDRAVNGQNPQSLIFSWVNSPGAPINTQFTLTVLELYEGQNPNDAFATNTIPYFEKTINSPTYLYNAIDPELRAGKKYAWRVKATDPNDKVYFKNDGVSEVCTFDYKSSGKDSSQISKSDIQTNTGNSSISGKANYFFVEKKKVGNKKFGFGNSSTDDNNRPENYPLKNASIKLVEVYSICEVYKVKRAVSKDSKGKYVYAMVDSLASLGNSSIPLLSTKPDPKYPQTSNCGAIIAHTKTDDAGNFHFDIPSSFQSKILDTFSLGAAQATDGKSHHLAYATGLWVKYGSPYYYSGGTVFFIQGKILKDDANVYQQAKNYSLKVNLKNFAEQKNYYTGKITPIQGAYNYDVDVYVLKYKKSSGAPDNECSSD